MSFLLREDQVGAYRNYHAAERDFRAGRLRPEASPPYLRLDVSSRCNLRCLQCVFTATRAASQDMQPQVLARIESELLPTAAAVQYGVEGEPFMFRAFDRLVSALGRHRPAYSRIFTNATLIDESTSRRLIAGGLADLAVSLDAASEETFARIRRTSLAAIVENLSRLRDLKRELGAERPIVTIHTVVMLENLSELAAIVRLSRRLGAAEVVFYPLFQYTPEMTAQSSETRLEETRRRLGEAIEEGVRKGLPVRLAPHLPRPRAPLRERIDERFYAGTLELLAPPTSSRPGRRIGLRVRVRNASPFTWYGSPGPSAHSDVAVSYHVYGPEGVLVDWEGLRTPLPRVMGPGSVATFEVSVALPDCPGEVILGFDLVNEGQRWFGLEQRTTLRLAERENGMACEQLPVESAPIEGARCQHPWKYASIRSNGEVFPCRFLSVPMGNLRQQGFRDIWHSETYERLRETVLDGSYDFCRGALCRFAAAPEGMFRARIEVLDAPKVVAPGAVAALRLGITNEGTARWNAEPTAGIPTRFMLSSLLYDEQRRLQPHEPQRATLPSDVAPGERAEVVLAWTAPLAPGNYVVGFEMNRRPVFEFTSLGSPPCELALRVESSRRPLPAVGASDAATLGVSLPTA